MPATAWRRPAPSRWYDEASPPPRSLGSLANSGPTASSAPNSRKRIAGTRFKAISAPSSTMPGALFPPIASTAIVICWVTLRGLDRRRSSGRLQCRSCDLPAIVISTRMAKMVRTLEFAAIRTFRIRRRFQRIVRTAHIAARWRGFLLRDGHCGIQDSGRSVLVISLNRRPQQQRCRRRCSSEGSG